ncbi:GatB/YqeY domain-containing protein [Oceanirhabdus sp. W0125-5]|uniref:GatB/YqeY domain-containing protein n=1 Tax=Oceanirhabdus sp. W0125-5 TaxID=2999116 RepID=UPI0022F2E032|nr:GatB/YqeY domain-containing protein [Oceanirhabdus sp. W0125-5]WBW95774.1 GatB/YqeY domain-containing protein [Oceanirhabdus sp. W0125-5]
MSLKEGLIADWKTAMKARDRFTANVLSDVRAAILNYEKSGQGEADDQTAMEIIAKEVKMRRDSVVEFKKGNRDDLIKKAEDEIDILIQYLPKQLTDEEILMIVSSVADEIGANSMKDMGKLMSAVIPQTKGKADGKLVNEIVREVLNR